MFSEEVIKFFRDLEFKGSVPDGISVMNPFRDNPKIKATGFSTLL